MNKSFEYHLKFYYSIGFECFPGFIEKINGKKKYKMSKWNHDISLDEALSMLNDETNAIFLKTGRKSNIFVIDCDLGNGKDGRMALNNRHIFIPTKTPTQVTRSGGKHYFFDFPNIRGTGTHSFHDLGVDTRGDGGLITMTPTHIKGGGSYSWEREITRQRLRWVPDSFLDLIYEKENQNYQREELNDNYVKRNFGDLSPKQKMWFEDALRESAQTKTGGRSEKDYKLCCVAKTLGIGKWELWNRVQGVNKFGQGKKYFEITWRKATVRP